jgi:hypothetical protein
MSMLRVFPIALTGLVAVGLPLTAQTRGAAALDVRDAWARPQADTLRPSAAYFTLRNRGPEPVVLKRASADVARRTELHETRDEGGMMRMVRRDSVVVPARGELVFRPGGLHVMLMRLSRPLAPGDTVRIELAGASGAPVVTVLAPVRAP